jgi:hypothetical protein
VGKTLSARQYTRWDQITPYLSEAFEKVVPEELETCRAVLYTPTVENTPKRIDQDIRVLGHDLKGVIYNAYATQQGIAPQYGIPECSIDVVIIDEADRLKMSGLEQVRDMYDRRAFGVLILIGMPGIEKRLPRLHAILSPTANRCGKNLPTFPSEIKK